MNRVILIGRLTNNAEVKTIGEHKVCDNLSLAQKDFKGNTKFYNLKAWGRHAEVLEQYTSKGDMICIEGHIEIEAWEQDVNGTKVKREKWVIGVDKVELLPNPKRDESKPQTQTQNKTQNTNERKQEDFSFD